MAGRIRYPLLFLVLIATVFTASANPLQQLGPRQQPPPTATASADTRVIQSFSGSRTSARPTSTQIETAVIQATSTPTPTPTSATTQSDNSLFSNPSVVAGIFTTAGILLAFSVVAVALCMYRRMNPARSPPPAAAAPVSRKIKPSGRSGAPSAFSSFYAPYDRSSASNSHRNPGWSLSRTPSSLFFESNHHPLPHHQHHNHQGRDDDAMSEVARTVRESRDLSIEITRRLEGNYMAPSPMNPTRPESDPFSTPINVFDLNYGSNSSPVTSTPTSPPSSAYPLRAPTLSHNLSLLQRGTGGSLRSIPSSVHRSEHSVDQSQNGRNALINMWLENSSSAPSNDRKGSIDGIRSKA